MEGNRRKRDPLTAIKAKCLDCMGNGPGARALVERCRSTDCALHPFRSARAMQEGTQASARIEGQMTLFKEIGA